MHTILLLSSARVSRNFLRSLNAVPCRGKKKKAAGKKAAAKPTDNDTDIDVDLSPFSESMKSTISALQRNLSSLRTSGAHPGLLDNVRVDAYGALSPLPKLAQVTVRDPRALVVSVFDAAVTASVERAIRGAGLNLNPSLADAKAGTVLVPVPRATRETREAMRKAATKEGEGARIAARKVRKTAMDAIKAVKADVPSDEFKRMEKDVQGMTDGAIKEIDAVVDDKVRDIDSP